VDYCQLDTLTRVINQWCFPRNADPPPLTSLLISRPWTLLRTVSPSLDTAQDPESIEGSNGKAYPIENQS